MDAVRGAGAPVKVRYSASLCGSIEQALKALQGYGLMALELIQNADDAKATELIFDVRDSELRVRNDAVFSSCGFEESVCPWETGGDPQGISRPCNFHAIATMASRSKVFAADQIGRFGIGFVSVYQLTDLPVIRSSGIQLTLNPLTGEGTADRITFKDGTEFDLAYAAAPSAIRDALNASTTPADVGERLVEEISKVLRSSLLFLRHLNRVEVRRAGVIVLEAVLDRKPNALEISFLPEGRTERWVMLTRDADDVIAQLQLNEKYPELKKLGRSSLVSVAIPSKSETVDGLLFAYLPTQQPTGMPLHINADFFPHASRQHIVLQGEQHERFWNESLLAGAAAALADNFELLKEVLGAKHLWELLEAAFKLKEQGPFSAFWKRLAPIARTSKSSLTTTAQWHLPSVTKMAPESLSDEQRAALSHIGLELLDARLRPHWIVLSSVGLTELRLLDIAVALETFGSEGVDAEDPHLEALWSAISLMLEASERRPDHQTALKRLTGATFLLDVLGTPVSPGEVWRLPTSVQRNELHKIIPDCPIVSDRISPFPRLLAIIDLYELGNFAAELSTSIATPEAAEQIIGLGDADVKAFYALLTSFPLSDGPVTVAKVLSDSPILRTQERFVEPCRGKLPGGFTDPVGHFEVLDVGLMTDAMQSFAQHVLGVTVLSFEEYIREHLEDILERDPTKEQYGSLLTEIANYKYRLDEEGVLDLLAECSFIKTRAGTFAKPADCYFWSASLESLLGQDPNWWVDESWLPEGPSRTRLRDLFEGKLGMSPTVSARHIVDRIEALSDEEDLEALGRSINAVLRHVVDNWSRLSDDDREVLGELAEVEFLPALADDEPSEYVYSPGEVYRAVRAAGFSSQVPVVNVPTLRQANAIVNELLDLWEMPTEPPTETIVRHLEHCIDTGTSPSDVTYMLLNERVEREDGLSSIDRLRDKAFIYYDEGFRASEHLFWLPPPFRRFWHAANRRMQSREPLYRRLGVRDVPEPVDYARLMVEITGQASSDQVDLDIHQECLRRLAEAVDGDADGAEAAIAILDGEECLFNIDGQAVWPSEALWIDSDQLVQPFGIDLNDRLVLPPDVERAAAARLFRKLAVQPVTEVIHLRLAETPDGTEAVEATELLQDRAPLLLWLAPNPKAHTALKHILAKIRISLTRSLLVQAVIDEFDPPVRSPATAADAFFDDVDAVLHVRGAKMSPNEWTAAFRALFSQLESHSGSVDLKPLVTTASFLMMFDTFEEAERNLRQGGYQPPVHKDEPSNWEEFADPDEFSDGLSDNEEELNEEPDPTTGSTPSTEGGQAREDRERDQQDGAGDESEDERDSEPSSSSSGSHAAGDDDDEDEYGSKTRSGNFGAEPSTQSGKSEGQAKRGVAGDRKRSETTTERHARRSRMLSYVERAGSERRDDADRGRENQDESDLIDSSAIKAVLKYEESHGRTPVEQPHNNPGYDVLSTAPDGSRRLIEVKGLGSNWTECGTKLSHIQYKMAQEHPTEFWLYVVENAPDMQHQVVSAIPDPFNLVREYWFDHNWRDAREEFADARQLNVRPGAFVKHTVWGRGEILEVSKRGHATQVKVRFSEGLRLIPFNDLLEVVD